MTNGLKRDWRATHAGVPVTIFEHHLELFACLLHRKMSQFSVYTSEDIVPPVLLLANALREEPNRPSRGLSAIGRRVRTNRRTYRGPVCRQYTMLR